MSESPGTRAGALASGSPWRDGVIYQLYVKSFADSDGDGIGDLDGITAKLDHLVRLGVDGLWLNPCYPSPDRDGGYDVADYFAIADVYGGNPAFLRLLDAAHESRLRVLLDLVPNHCSNEHPWFRTALAEPRGGPYRGRFFFRDGRGPDGGEPPNNWTSVFGGPAWTRIREPGGELGQWYLHLFDSGQPDFDWRNPEVPAYFEQVLRYWFELGVDGFRIDVAHGLLKAAGLPDFDPEVDAASPMVNQPEVHDVYRAWRSIAESYRPDRDVVFVAEAWAPTARDYAAFVRPDELHQAFYFDLLMQPWDAGCFRTSVQRGLDALAETAGSDPASVGVFAWTLNNHDVFRAVTRYGIVERAPPRSLSRQASAVRPLGTVDVELGTARARAAALFLLGLPGSVYLYQGEELGLPEVLDLPDDRRQDPIWAKSGGTDPGRDGCRVPLPWTSDEDGFGFSLVRTATSPWLPQPDSFGPLAASAQAADPNSMLTLYRDALRVRRRLLAVAPREHEWLEVGDRDDVVAYARGPLTVVTNFGGEPFSLPRAWGTPLLATVRTAGAMLPGNSGAWLATG